ncbi:hypothetical protein ABZ622_22220 [Streptomyces sp. NPDC007164]|uniref:hypothetical protein n=1 Tax=Streptomyces sp. NPDC007164 TaxID=3156918 RepID=UPI0033EACAD8
MKRHADLKIEFCERIRTEAQQMPETEKRLRLRLRQTVSCLQPREEITELRRLATSLTLAGAVRIQREESAADNVVPFRPPLT